MYTRCNEWLRNIPWPCAPPCCRWAHGACAERCQGTAHTQRQYGGGLLLEGCWCRRCLHNVNGISSASGKTTVTPEACRRDLDKMTRLADYFVVVGYDLDKRGKRETHSKRFFLLLLFPSSSSSWSVRLECISRGLFTVNTAEGGGRGTQSRHSWFRPGMGELLSAADVPGLWIFTPELKSRTRPKLHEDWTVYMPFYTIHDKKFASGYYFVVLPGCDCSNRDLTA